MNYFLDSHVELNKHHWCHEVKKKKTPLEDFLKVMHSCSSQLHHPIFSVLTKHTFNEFGSVS